ncbi:hypothetical protein G4B88_016677 [Cannabis sativa]|uniref:Enhancer of mRNA-decapping protein 4 n=1 Tax=Cannabis sativa TaxID=3483 RepID=A0A7J6H7U8_CANSA|nr:hypothetical protein G4B88_016677 [Cannabis sativa]
MASPGNPNPQSQSQPQQQTFDMQSFFKPTTTTTTTTTNPNSQNPNNNSSSSTTHFPIPPPSSYPPPSSSSSAANFSYPPQTSPFHHHQFQYHHPQLHHHHLPPPQHQQIPYSLEQQAHQIHQQRSLSYPTPPLQPSPSPPPPNSGARIMALLSASPPPPPPSSNSSSSSSPIIELPPMIPMGINPTGPIRMPSSKLPKGRHLNGDHVVYDVDVRLQGEAQPQLEVSPITKYGSDPQLVLGRQIAVNKSYICYGLKQGNIRTLNIHTAIRSLFRGHTQRVTDMAFFAEDVHLLASVSVEGRLCVWKISEGPGGEEGKQPEITGKIVIAVQITGEGEASHPRICWHCHKQEMLVVGFGKRVLRFDTTKVGKGKVFSAEEPIKCPVEKLVDGVQFVGKHDGEITDLSMCQWMATRLVSASVDGTIKIWEDRKAQPLAVLRPHDGHPVNSATFLTAPHRPEHIILITAGPLNREVKIWASASEEGWLLPSESESWKCTQTLELKSSTEPRVEDAFFNQVVALPQAGLLLLANAKKNAIYAVHLEYGPNPVATRMDYIAEFTVTMPILSFTGASISPHGEHILQVFCVQTQAIQQYALDLSQCLPPPIENSALDRSESNVSRDRATVEGFPEISPLKPTAQASNSESAMRYPVGSSIEATSSKEIMTRSTEVKSVGLTPTASDADIVCAPSPPLPLSPRLSGKLSGFRTPLDTFESGTSFSDHASGEQANNDYPVDDDSRNGEKKLSQDDFSSVVNSTSSGMYKHPTHLITPSEILMAASSESTKSVECKAGGEANTQDVLVNGDADNTELEVKTVGESRSNQNDDFRVQEESTKVSENKEKYFCSQASDLGIEMARERAISNVNEGCSTDEARQVDDASSTEAQVQPTHASEEDQDSTRDTSAKASESCTSTAANPMQTPNTKSKKKAKNSQASGSSSPYPGVLNSVDSSNEPGGSSSLEAAFPQIVAMQEMLNQLMTMQKDMQKHMSMMVAVPVTKEGRRLEAAIGRSMEKAVKASNDALWARFQEESAKNDKIYRDRTQQIVSLISNLMGKDLPALLDKTLKKEISAVGPAVIRAITPAIEKTISSVIAESFQRGVGDKAVNQLEKSVNSKLEATVARQIQAQFQTTGKQALQEALKSSFDSSVIPAFEMSCKAMFEQVDATFQKGMAEHSNATQQHFESSHSPLALTLRDAMNAASSVTQTLSGELADGQRKLIALAAAGAKAGGVNPLVTQLSNGPLGGLHEKIEVPLDPTKELSRLISEQKYEEAFTGALQRTDLTIVSWLCSQVDLRGLLSMSPLPLSQGVLLSLLQQLACDINKETTRKLGWMTDVAAAINPTDPMIAMHVRPIFEQVYQILHHQRNLPTINGAEITSIRLLMHVINSMLMTCK